MSLRRARAIRLGLISSARMERDRSSATTSALERWYTGVGSCRQAGPARETITRLPSSPQKNSGQIRARPFWPTSSQGSSRGSTTPCQPRLRAL